MRSDMAKVLVERPRPGSRWGNPPRKSYVSQARRALQRSLVSGDSPPQWEPRWQRIGSRRHFNEHLSPLKRYLRKQVGRPWNKVYSEICAHINRNNIVQKHILTHLFEFVALHVVEVDGKIKRGDNKPLGFWNQFYVCPRTGLLRLTPRPGSWRQYYRQFYGRPGNALSVEAVQSLDEYHLCMKINDVWELVEVRPLPALLYRPLCQRSDVILNTQVCNLSEADVRPIYGRPVFAISRQIINDKDRKQFPIPW